MNLCLTFALFPSGLLYLVGNLEPKDCFRGKVRGEEIKLVPVSLTRDKKV